MVVSRMSYDTTDGKLPYSALWEEDKLLSTHDGFPFEGELAESAVVLEQRYQSLGVTTRKILASEWSAIPADVLRAIPGWIPNLLTKHSLAGGVIEDFDGANGSARPFILLEPKDYVAELGDQAKPFATLPSFGFVPIAHDTKGNVWVTKINDGLAGPIYLLDRSGQAGRFPWQGGEPDKRNGLVFASSRLSLLFASMAVSELSFKDQTNASKSMWSKKIPQP
jgi:hypothetical protein